MPLWPSKGLKRRVFRKRLGMAEWKAHPDRYNRIATHAQAKSRVGTLKNGPWRARTADLRQTVIVVDDGIATGATLNAALHWLKAKKPERIVMAVPCAPPDAVQAVPKAGHEILCLKADPLFAAVGQYYSDFRPTTDAEASAALKRARPPAK